MGHLHFDEAGKVRKGTPDAWLPVAAQVSTYARKFAGRGDIIANIGPDIGGPFATACWSPLVADMDVNTETCLPGYTPARVDFRDEVFQLGALPFVGAVTHEAAHARWTCWVPAQLVDRRKAGAEKWTQATVEVIIALEESRIETLAVMKDPSKRAALAQCALSIVLKDFKVNNTLFGASISLALTVGRYALLSADEVEKFRALIEPHLPRGLMARLEALIREYHGLPQLLAKDGMPDDAFFAAMYSIAERWLIAIRETAAEIKAEEDAKREADEEDAPADEDEVAAEDEPDDESDDAYSGGREPDEDDEHREGPESADGDPGAGGTDDGAGAGAGSPDDEGTGTPPEDAEAHDDGEPVEDAEDGEDGPGSDDLDADDDSDADGAEGGSEPSDDDDVEVVGDGEDEPDEDEPVTGDDDVDEDYDDEGEPEDTDVREYGTPDHSEPAEDNEDDETSDEDEGAPESGAGRYDDDDSDFEGEGEGEGEGEPAEPTRNMREEQPDLRSGIPGEDEETGATVIVIVITDEGEGDEGDAPDDSLGDEIREAAGEAAMGREAEALDERAEKVAERKIEDKRIDHKRMVEARNVRDERHGEGSHDFERFCRSHKLPARTPEPGERVAANRLAATLERITFHDRAVRKVDRVVPGGKLRPRAAVAKAADRDRGGRAEVPIWRAKERRHTAETPVTVGILTDVSGSMSYLAEPSAVTTYVVSQAVGTIEGKVATATFGNEGFLVNRAYERTPKVQPWAAKDGIEAFREGALLLDAELTLLDGEGARILIIFSDAQLVNGEDATYAATFMRLCKQKNVAVIWCSYDEDPIQNFGYGAMLNLTGTPADIANTLGAAILTEVSKVEASRGA